MIRVSKGFIAAVGGIAMTLLAWFGSWAWPGWPASFAIDLLGFADFADFPRYAKSVVVVLLIIINVGTWAAVMRAAMMLPQIQFADCSVIRPEERTWPQ